jgi:type IV pilus assembly protein PilM
MDDDSLKKALPWEARGKLPIDPAQALLRHVVAGEVYQDSEPKNEVVLMAASREMVNQYLAAAARARLDVVGMNVEPKAMIDCFSQIYRRKIDGEATSCFVDIGNTASRAIIARAGQILFARVIPIGGDHFTRAVASDLKISAEEAKLLRIKLCCAQPQFDEAREKQQIAPAPTVESEFALLSAGLNAHRNGDSKHEPSPEGATATETLTTARATPQTGNDPAAQARAVEQACREPLNRLVEELDSCRRYYEATFPNKPVDRLIFVGGEARQRSLCQHIAREMSLAAQVGDPLVRMGRISDVGIESGIDRRQPQPGWAVAIGLSMGPVLAPVKVEA